MTSEQLRQLDRRLLWHPFTHMKLWLEDEQSLVIVGGDGCELIDSDGRRYLDGVSSLWCNVHGHRVAEIDDAIRAQLGKIAHTTLLGLSNEPAILLAAKLASLAPRGLTKVMYASDGACATEIAFKLAVQYWWNRGRREKCEFVGLTDGYHGDTVGAMSVGHSAAFHRPYQPLLFKTHDVVANWRSPGAKENDGVEASLARVERVLAEHSARIAAICVEPLVMGAAGMLVQPRGFLRGLRELADRHGVLLIADEVATGFGRTGTMFACEQEDVTPDLLCLGKGLTGGYLPLAATLATQAVFDAFLGEPHEGRTFFHGHTFGGNPLACAAALASIQLFEKRNVLQHVKLLSDACASRLQHLPAASPHVGAVRQHGLMIGVDLVRDASTSAPFDARLRVGASVCRGLRDRGVILRPLGDTLVILPPLATSVEQVDQIFAALEAELANLQAYAAPAPRAVGDVIAGDF